MKKELCWLYSLVVCLVFGMGYAEQQDSPFTNEELKEIEGLKRTREQEVIDWARGDEVSREKVYEMAKQYGDYRSTQAMYELGRFNTSRAANVLYEIAKTASDVDSSTAIRNLKAMSPSLALPHLIALLSELDSSSKRVLISELRNFPGEETEKALLDTLAEIDYLKETISTLGYIGTEKSLEKINEIAEEDLSPSLKSIANMTRKRINARLEGKPDPLPEARLTFVENQEIGAVFLVPEESDIP